jgi:hypothetical protein
MVRGVTGKDGLVRRFRKGRFVRQPPRDRRRLPITASNEARRGSVGRDRLNADSLVRLLRRPLNPLVDLVGFVPRPLPPVRLTAQHLNAVRTRLGVGDEVVGLREGRFATVEEALEEDFSVVCSIVVLEVVARRRRPTALDAVVGGSGCAAAVLAVNTAGGRERTVARLVDETVALLDAGCVVVRVVGEERLSGRRALEVGAVAETRVLEVGVEVGGSAAHVDGRVSGTVPGARCLTRA